MSSDGRWVICTRPVIDEDRAAYADDITIPDGPGMVMYTVVDFDGGVRGPSTSWGSGFKTEEQITESMVQFETGRAEVSRRYDVRLVIEDVQSC